MIYHVLPGDSVAAEFSKTGLDGEVIVCREAFVDGDLSGDTLAEFWQHRAHFLMIADGADEIDYHENVAGELSKIADLPVDAEINLWFEYELFCSVNMWFCLSLLNGADAAVYRVEPSILEREDRWKGFGSSRPEDLKACFDTRTKFEPADVRLGVDLWRAFKNGDRSQLRLLGETKSKCFPYLREVCEAATELETKPEEIVREIVASGKKDIADVFPEFARRAGVYGFGDLQVQQILRSL